MKIVQILVMIFQFLKKNLMYANPNAGMIAQKINYVIVATPMMEDALKDGVTMEFAEIVMAQEKNNIRTHEKTFISKKTKIDFVFPAYRKQFCFGTNYYSFS